MTAFPLDFPIHFLCSLLASKVPGMNKSEKGLEKAVCWEATLFLSDQEIGDGSSLSRDISVALSPNLGHKKTSFVISTVLLASVVT